MVRKIIMIYGKGCIDSAVLKPIVLGFGMGGKYKFSFHESSEPDTKKIKDKYDSALKDTGKENAVPMFIDEDEDKAIFAPNFEKLIAWLEGPDWWKKY